MINILCGAGDPDKLLGLLLEGELLACQDPKSCIVGGLPLRLEA
jgi:hypothetical protein